jgi:hypothetical protein
MTGLELGEYLSQWVTDESNGTQHPRAGKIRDYRFNMGDFIFRSPTGAIDAPKSAPEAEAWMKTSPGV